MAVGELAMGWKVEIESQSATAIARMALPGRE